MLVYILMSFLSLSLGLEIVSPSPGKECSAGSECRTKYSCPYWLERENPDSRFIFGFGAKDTNPGDYRMGLRLVKLFLGGQTVTLGKSRSEMERVSMVVDTGLALQEEND